MARAAVKDAIEARLDAATKPADFPPHLKTNETGEAPALGTDYIMIQYPVADTNQISVGAPGNNIWREEGAVRFVLHTQRGVGDAHVDTWVTFLTNLYQGKLFDGVECYGASSEDGNDTDQGSYYITTVTLPFRHDVFG